MGEGNPYFENKVLNKTFWQLHQQDMTQPSRNNFETKWKPTEIISESEEIKWKSADKNLIAQSYEMDEISFFSWFTDHTNAKNDESANHIIDDLWPRALSYFFGKGNNDNDDDDEWESDGDDDSDDNEESDDEEESDEDDESDSDEYYDKELDSMTPKDKIKWLVDKTGCMEIEAAIALKENNFELLNIFEV